MKLALRVQLVLKVKLVRLVQQALRVLRVQLVLRVLKVQLVLKGKLVQIAQLQDLRVQLELLEQMEQTAQ